MRRFRKNVRTGPPPGLRGSTTLELLLYFAVIGVVLSAAIGFSLEFLMMTSRSAASREISRDGRYALSLMAAEVRAAAGVNGSDSVFGAHPGRLSLATDDPASDPTVFAVEDGRLAVSRGGGPFEPMSVSALSVGEFTVEDLSVPGRNRTYRIRLALQAEDPLRSSPVTVLFEDTVQVRAGSGFPE